MSDERRPENHDGALNGARTEESGPPAGGGPSPAGPPASDSTARFKVGRVIGEGGMATVLEAEDTRLQRTVAVKRLKPKAAQRPDHRNRFFNEARILGGLFHPGAVPVYDAGTTDEGEPFYAMEKVQGENLFRLLRDRGPEDLHDGHGILKFVDRFERVCQTVAYAHSRGIVHRDVKPGNVMVDRYGAVYVVDWGIAKQLATEEAPFAVDETRDGVVMGTPGYMSPEQARGLADAADFKTDVFALGVILYEILTGKRPFRGESSKEIVEEILHHEPDPPLSLNRKAGRELSAICMKALAKDPRRRYPSARELADDIARFRQFLPVSAIRPRLVDRVGNWVRRHKVASAVLVTSLVAVLGVSGFLGTRAHQRRQLVDRVMSVVDRSLQEIDELKLEMNQVEQQLGQPGLDQTTRRELDSQLADLDARVTVMNIGNRSRLAAVIGSTFSSPDPRAAEMYRAQTAAVIEEFIELEEYALARAFIGSALEHYESSNVLGYSAEDAERMGEMLVEIERMERSSPDPGSSQR